MSSVTRSIYLYCKLHQLQYMIAEHILPLPYKSAQLGRHIEHLTLSILEWKCSWPSSVLLYGKFGHIVSPQDQEQRYPTQESTTQDDVDLSCYEFCGAQLKTRYFTFVLKPSYSPPPSYMCNIG